MKLTVLKLVLSVQLTILCVDKVGAQPMGTLDISTAYALVERNYPLSRNAVIISEMSSLNQDILKKSRLPILTANADGRLQTENVTIMSGDPEGLNFEVPLESYRVYLGMDYMLFDGGIASSQKQIEAASLKLYQKELEVNLRPLKDRVNQLYFSVLMARQKQALLETSVTDIKTNIKSLEAGMRNGTVLESEVSKLQVRLLELASENAGLLGDIKAYISVLGELVGQELDDNVELLLPKLDETMLKKGLIGRPELEYYQQNEKLINAQEGLIEAGRKPRVSLYAQGGLGYPNPLNFVDINSSTYALGGLKVGWNITDWNRSKAEKEKLILKQNQNQIAQETFEHDINARRGEFIERMTAINLQLENDLKIVELQKQILQQTSVQLTNGVINSNDYLIQINAELNARQQLELHRIQLQQLHINYLTLIGQL